MRDRVLLDGDKAMFLPAFGMALVVVQPGTLAASGPMKALSKRVCVSGDESSVSVPGCVYTAGPYAIPGSGTLAISALAGDQLASISSTGGVKLMVVGSKFTAKFSVQSPAQQPAPPGPPVPDPTAEYSGQGMFQTLNTQVKAG